MPLDEWKNSWSKDIDRAQSCLNRPACRRLDLQHHRLLDGEAPTILVSIANRIRRQATTRKCSTSTSRRCSTSSTPATRVRSTSTCSAGRARQSRPVHVRTAPWTARSGAVLRQRAVQRTARRGAMSPLSANSAARCTSGDQPLRRGPGPPAAVLHVRLHGREKTTSGPETPPRHDVQPVLVRRPEQQSTRTRKDRTSGLTATPIQPAVFEPPTTT